MELIVEIVTFTEELYPSSKNEGFTHGRSVWETETDTVRLEVFNSTTGEVKQVRSFKIPVKERFLIEKGAKWAGIYIHDQKKRVQCKVVGDEVLKNGLFLSKYIYTLTYGKEVPEGYEIDHINGKKLDDRVENLTCITSEHNKLKRGYAFWLFKYNEETGESLEESNLVDMSVLNKVVEHFGERIHELRKERKYSNTKDWRERSYEYVKEYSKNYKKENYELTQKWQQEWRDKNKELRNAKAKEYRDNDPSAKRKMYLSRKIQVLQGKKWTPELAKSILEHIEEVFTLFKTTPEEVAKGLDTREFKHHTISYLHRLILIAKEQSFRLQYPEDHIAA